MVRWNIVWLVALATIAMGGWLEQAAAQEISPGGGPGGGQPRMHRPDGAQPGGPGGPGEGMHRPRGPGEGGPGRPAPLTPEQIKAQAEKARQDAADQVRQDMGATEEEWTNLQPLIEKIKACRNDLRGTNAAAAQATRAANPDGDPPEKTEIEKKTAELKTLLKDKDAQPARIKPALEALRQARAKVQQELDKAVKDLRKLTNVRGEAYLLSTGVLE